MDTVNQSLQTTKMARSKKSRIHLNFIEHSPADLLSVHLFHIVPYFYRCIYLKDILIEKMEKQRDRKLPIC